MTLSPPIEPDPAPPSPEGVPQSAPVVSAPSSQEGFRAHRGTRLRARRGPDYRLRGLDLSAQTTREPTELLSRTSHPARRRQRRLALQWLAILGLGALVAFGIRVWAVEPYTVPSSAMAPTLHTGDRILVVKPSLLRGPIGTGDIIVFRHPSLSACGGVASGPSDLVQRVIGLPGQTIWSADGHVFVNGRQLTETGWFNAVTGELGSAAIPRTQIPPGDYFVMGDDRANSCDSRAFGAIPGSSVIGKVRAIVLRGGHPHIHLF